MKLRLVTFFKFVLLLAIASILMWFAFRGVKLSRILTEISKAKVVWVLLSVVPSMIAFVSRAYRWNLLIEPLGYYPSLKKTTYAVIVGYFANLAFPRLGEVTRCGTLTKSERIPFNSLLGTVVTERVVDVISLLVCLAITAAIEYKRLGSFLLQNIVKPFTQQATRLTSPFLWVIAIILVIIAFFLVRVLKKKPSNNRSKILQLIKGVVDGLKTIGRLERPWAFIFHSVFIWSLYLLSMYICFFALPATADLNFSAALFLLVAGGLGMSAPVQGGIGAYHLLVSQGLMLYGLSQEDGLAYATLVHSSQMILVTILGSLSIVLFFIDAKKRELGNNAAKGKTVPSEF
jgi:glycosyltransferase 2 family protein